MAEKYLLYLEVLFATMDDLEWHFAQLRTNGTFQGIYDYSPLTGNSRDGT
jgi:hypothetical protein